jgi:hypothetical protein
MLNVIKELLLIFLVIKWYCGYAREFFFLEVIGGTI